MLNSMQIPAYKIIDGDYLPRSEANVLGAKNLLYTSLADVKVLNTSGTWTNNSYVFNGITYVYNTNGTVSVSGTATSSGSNFCFLSANKDAFYNKFTDNNLILSGCPEGGSSEDNGSYRLNIYESGNSGSMLIDSGEGVVISHDWFAATTNIIYVRIRVSPSYVFQSAKTFKPMIRLASDLDDTYVLPTLTNRALSVYEDFTSELVRGENCTSIDLYAFRLGSLVVIQGRWNGSFSSTNDTIVTYPERFNPRRGAQIRGNGVVVSGSGDTLMYSDGYYWASPATHRIGQSQTAAAKGGCFTFIWAI